MRQVPLNPLSLNLRLWGAHQVGRVQVRHERKALHPLRAPQLEPLVQGRRATNGVLEDTQHRLEQ